MSENKFSERFYHSRPAFAISNGYELDFWVKSRLDEKRYGIEVKSGKNSGVSIKKMLDTKKVDYTVYVKGNCSCGSESDIYTLPIFLFNKFSFNKGGTVKRDELPRYRKDSFVGRLNAGDKVKIDDIDLS